LQLNTINLDKRVAVVTGGAQGIGYEVADRFLRSSARLVIWDVNEDGLQTAKGTLAAATGRDDIHTMRVDIATY
jgi:3-oxoacyl-[acyl-carrier protein] reductase